MNAVISRERIVRTPTDASSPPKAKRKKGRGGDKYGYAMLAGVYRDAGYISFHILCGERYSENGYLEGDILDLRIGSKHIFSRANNGLVGITKHNGQYYFPCVFRYHKDHWKNKGMLWFLSDLHEEIYPGEKIGKKELVRQVKDMTHTDEEDTEIEKILDFADFSGSRFLYMSEMVSLIEPPVIRINWRKIEQLTEVSYFMYTDIKNFKRNAGDLVDSAELLCNGFLEYTRKPCKFKPLKREDIPENLRKYEIIDDHLDEVRYLP